MNKNKLFTTMAALMLSTQVSANSLNFLVPEDDNFWTEGAYSVQTSDTGYVSFVNWELQGRDKGYFIQGPFSQNGEDVFIAEVNFNDVCPTHYELQFDVVDPVKKEWRINHINYQQADLSLWVDGQIVNVGGYTNQWQTAKIDVPANASVYFVDAYDVNQVGHSGGEFMLANFSATCYTAPEQPETEDPTAETPDVVVPVVDGPVVTQPTYGYLTSGLDGGVGSFGFSSIIALLMFSFYKKLKRTYD